jgi:hypothetical protein
MAMSTNVKDLAFNLLKEGKIKINEKTGRPDVKDLREHPDIQKAGGMARSYAYSSIRRYLKWKKAEEGGALPPTPTIKQKEVPKPPPPTRRPEPPPEPEASLPRGVTEEDVEEELKWFEDSLTDFYEMLLSKEDSIILLLTKDEDYGRPTPKLKKLAHRWTQWIRRRMEPDTLEGWDTYFLLGDHIFGIIAPLLMIWYRKMKEAEKKEG